MSKRSPALVRAQEAYEAATAKINVRLSADEKARLQALAAKAGTTPTGLIKEWIARARP